MTYVVSLAFLTITVLYSLVVNIIFFYKKHIDTEETKIFGKMLVTNLIGIMLEILCIVFLNTLGKDNIITIIINRTFLVYFIVILYLFSNYVINTSYLLGEKKNERVNKVLKKSTKIVYGMSIVLLLFLKMNLYNENGMNYSYGPAVNLVYVVSAITSLLSFVHLLVNFKSIKNKKNIPIIAFLLLMGGTAVIQILFPQITLATSVEALVIFIMFHTIENPDMKLLEELNNSKEISDNANEEKTLFIYNLTQDIRSISNAIDDDADYILDSNNWDETYECARNIKHNSAKFITMTNEILDISQIDSSNIKTHNNKYSIKNILKQVINVYGDLCKNKDLKFITNIDHDVPEILYGDGIGLKEALITILNNSVKYTNKGFVELNVNTIIKNDICRLIITIEDSGIGIKSEEINNIKNNNTSLSNVNKLITLMHGTMLISSSYGVGTKIKLILDQKIEISKDKEIDKYEKVLEEIKLLAVDDSEAGLKIIEKLLKGTKVQLTKVTTGKECIDKIKTNKYDLILLDEELSQITANELIVKLKEIRNFKTPVVLLTKDNSYEYNDEYLKQGFIGYILKPLKKDIFINEINKYSNNN